MNCQMCNKDKKLICSHIIPESFYRSAYPENNGLMVSRGKHAKRLPVGIYDKEIICAECEKIFSSWDDYGNKFFSDILMNPQRTVTKNGNDKALVFGGIKILELKLFLMSVLWRAAICNQSFFNQISLGTFKDNLREKILNSNPGDIDDFSIIIFKLNLTNADVLHPPHRFRLDNGINGYKMYFFNAEIFIKVDKRPIGVYRSLILNPNQPLVVFLTEPLEAIRWLDKVPR